MSNFLSNHSPSSNCEIENVKGLDNLRKMLTSPRSEQQSNVTFPEVTIEDKYNYGTLLRKGKLTYLAGFVDRRVIVIAVQQRLPFDMTEVDVFTTNITLVDPEIYQLWIEGHTASEAVAILNDNGLGQETGASIELIISDVLDHYRTYSMLEKLFCNPNNLQEQLTFQIHPQSRAYLIEKYYEFDDDVIRELLGKKLSSKNRKDLDEVSEKSGKPLKSCRRQFDNIKRVFKVVEEMPGAIVENIKQSFQLSDDLAKKYACVVFIACIRFDTSKKKLQHLSFNSWKACSEIIMEQWTYNISGLEYDDTEMDKEFLLELRELKILLDKEKDHKHLVCVNLKPKLLQKNYSDLESNFRIYTRSILSLATALHRSRNMKDLFIDLAQISEHFKQNHWSNQDLELFLIAYYQTAIEIDAIRVDLTLKACWEKFMKVITKCLLIIYK